VFFNFDSILLLLPCVGFLCGSMFVTLCSKHAVTSCFRHSESLIECEAPFTSSLIGLRIRASPQVSADVVGGVSKGNHSFSTKRGGDRDQLSVLQIFEAPISYRAMCLVL
jgi:hypothetical protein